MNKIRIVKPDAKIQSVLEDNGETSSGFHLSDTKEIDIDKMVEVLARWLRTYQLKEVEGTGDDCITPWTKCPREGKDYWRKEARGLLTYLQEIFDGK